MSYSITLTQLRYIVAVDTHKHFAKAAKSCFVSQPTLSMQIQKLEEQLGITIFDRTQKPIAATDIGEVIIKQARTILREAAGIESLIKQTKETYSGTIKLGIIPTVAPYAIPLVAEPFRKQYPNIFIRVQELTTPHILAALEHDEIDAGIIATAENGHKFIETNLFKETFINFVSPNHTLSGESNIAPYQLVLNEMWLLSEGHCFRDQAMQLCRTDPDFSLEARQPYFDCGYIDTLIRMVETVGGMTLLPELAVHFLSEAQKEYLRPFQGQAPTRTVRLIQKNSFLKRHLIEAFATSIKECVSPYVNQTFE